MSGLERVVRRLTSGCTRPAAGEPQVRPQSAKPWPLLVEAESAGLKETTYALGLRVRTHFLKGTGTSQC